MLFTAIDHNGVVGFWHELGPIAHCAGEKECIGLRPRQPAHAAIAVGMDDNAQGIERDYVGLERDFSLTGDLKFPPIGGARCRCDVEFIGEQLCNAPAARTSAD